MTAPLIAAWWDEDTQEWTVEARAHADDDAVVLVDDDLDSLLSLARDVATGS